MINHSFSSPGRVRIATALLNTRFAVLAARRLLLIVSMMSAILWGSSITAAIETESQARVNYDGWLAPDDINQVKGVNTRASGGGQILQSRDGSVVIKTAQANQFAFVSFDSSTDFDASAGGILEVEFEMRVDSVVQGRDGAVLVQVFGYPVAGVPRRIDLIFDIDNVRFFSSQPKANDASYQRTYRLRIQPDKAELFVEGQDAPVVWTSTFGGNLVPSLNELRIGDISANDSLAGTSTWRKLIWRSNK